MTGSTGSGTEMSDSSRGQLAVVFRGVQAQRLDVPQQGDLLLQLSLGPAELDDVGQEIGEQPVPVRCPLLAADQGVDLPERQGQELDALVPLDLVVALLVQQDDLRGRELS